LSHLAIVLGISAVLCCTSAVFFAKTRGRLAYWM
jgi:ABC-type polysaccharide/polyol phosphate export permease